jgi:5-methylcytosine-specific restriction protein B
VTADPPAAEQTFRRRWYEVHRSRFKADVDAVSAQSALAEGFSQSGGDALSLRADLARTGDVEAFRAGLQGWAVRPGTLAFNGFSGQMLVNQLVKRSEDLTALARLLPEVLAAPRDDVEAQAKIQSLVGYIETIRVGAHPATGHVPFLLSYFWALADHDKWPVLWTSAAAFADFITGEPLPSEPARRYSLFQSVVATLDESPGQFELVARWWADSKPVFLDRVVVDRCQYGLDADTLSLEALATNADALVVSARHIGTSLVDELSAAIGRTLMVRTPVKLLKGNRPRSDVWVDWWASSTGLGIRLWVNDQGVSIGLIPGWVRNGWFNEAGVVVAEASLPGFSILAARGSRDGHDLGYAGGRPGDFTYARSFEPQQLESLDVRREVVDAAVLLQPVLDRLLQLATGEEPPAIDDPLLPLVEEFRARGYPTPAVEEDRAERERFEAMLADDAIALADPAQLRRIWNTGRYGSPGPQAILNTSLRDADAGEYDRIIAAISYLCWGHEDDAKRIDQVLDDKTYAVKGLGESVIVKLLAICHPERYIPVFPFSGPKGKRRMLQLLGLQEPGGDSRGQLQVRANDALRSRLDRLFPGDPLGMANFLYWYAERPLESEEIGEVDLLDELAASLLVDRAFLDDIVAMLEDKGQVILYGPPGTGKTYLARKLAEVLAPDPTRRSLVQFHPSTSYEDFFEGYRPEVIEGGQMTYRLTPGPLALLADRARDAPGKRHIMIIDEINRANLPKVLGELLFLFEYRDEQVRTLYRPDDAFELPKDLWFIGTMNTADRSIALVDAALRRRFHFIPIFPNHGPMQGLLDRWLNRHEGSAAWVGELVAQVNDELTGYLGGPHLQLGPSYFMHAGINESVLERIWRYNIEPFVEDQFFGDPARIDYFRFAKVLARYKESVGIAATAPMEEVVAELRPGDGA